MQVTFTLTQGTHYTQTIAVNLNPSITCSFGQLVGSIAFKFFRSTILIRKCGNKGFKFNDAFDFILDVDGLRLCDTIESRKAEEIETSEKIQSKARMSNTKEGQARFIKLLCAMLYSSLDETYKASPNKDVYDISYTAENSDAEIRTFLDTQVVDFLD
jgi:hypothetical protein